MKRLGLLVVSASILFLSVSISSIALAYSNGDFGNGTYGSCSFGSACSISISSSGSVSLNVTPTPYGSCTTQSDTVSVLTDDSNGYTLTLADGNTNTSLINGGSSISATSGTFSSPVALADNTWGYRVDSLGSFGSGPTTSHTNTSLNSTTFASLEPSNSTPDTLANTSAAADPAVNTTVWYSVCADTSVSSGAYTSQVTYTALAN